MKYTGNYNLKKPDGTDVINIEDFNENADIIDAELKKLNTNKVDKVTGKGLSTNDYTDEEKQKNQDNADNISDLQQELETHKADNIHVPSGIISMWYGLLENIPDGWALCDGENDTPDLRDRFIVGAGNEYNVGDTGGEKEVTLTEEQIPSHSHGSGTLSTGSAGSHSHSSGTLSTSTTGSHTHSVELQRGYTRYLTTGNLASMLNGSTTTSSSGSHSHSISGRTASGGSHSHTISGNTANTGGGEAHENRPPYFALAFIMKL